MMFQQKRVGLLRQDVVAAPFSRLDRQTQHLRIRR